MTTPEGSAPGPAEPDERAVLRDTLAALRDREERLAFALDATTDGLWDWDVPSGQLTVNARWSTMLGYEPGEIATTIETFNTLAHPDDLPTAYRELERHIAGAIAQVEFEMRLRRRDGSWSWVLNRAKIVARDATGAPLRIVGTHTDITARRQQAEALQEQTTLLETILANIPIAVDIISADGRIEYINEFGEQLLGWSQEDLRGVNALELVYPDETVRAAVVASILEGYTGWREFPARARDGREVMMSWSSVRLADGRVIGIGRDVTTDHAVAAERERLERQLQETQQLESLGVLAGGIAHDFNNLLVGVMGNASLAEATLPRESPERALIADVRAAAARASELTRQLLAYAGKGRFVIGPLDVSTIVREMATLLRAAVSKAAVFESELATQLPLVEADATQLRQIVMNLITNASDAIGDHAGTITLRTGLVTPTPLLRQSVFAGDTLGDGPHVFVEVRDTGHGMAPATLRRIFDPFFTTKFTGRGLGLAATLGIIRSHRGAIRVESAVGQGTTITIYLPAMAGTQAAAAVAATAPPPVLKLTGDVLLADDEDLVRRVTSRVLQTIGFTVAEYPDGRAALDAVLAEPERWRLVVLDLTMPQLAGDAALKEMRRVRPDLPAILCSGYTDESLDESLTRTAHIAFVQKPFTIAALSGALRQVLGDESAVP